MGLGDIWYQHLYTIKYITHTLVMNTSFYALQPYKPCKTLGSQNSSVLVVPGLFLKTWKKIAFSPFFFKHLAVPLGIHSLYTADTAPLCTQQTPPLFVPSRHRQRLTRFKRSENVSFHKTPFLVLRMIMWDGKVCVCVCVGGGGWCIINESCTLFLYQF